LRAGSLAALSLLQIACVKTSMLHCEGSIFAICRGKLANWQPSVEGARLPEPGLAILLIRWIQTIRPKTMRQTLATAGSRAIISGLGGTSVG
jgi:hypothetical protein